MQPGVKWILILGAMFLILSASMFMSIFSALPLVMIILMFGRLRGYAMTLGILGISFLISPMLQSSMASSMFLVSLLASLVAVVISESFFRRAHPMRSIVTSGGLIILLSIGVLTILMQSGFSPKAFLTEQFTQSTEFFKSQKALIQNSGNSDAMLLSELFSNPSELADLFLKAFPIYFFIGVFFTLWANFYMVLRTYHFYAPPELIKYSEFTFLSFRMPDQALYLVIAALCLALYGDFQELENYTYFGTSLLKCLGIFYFFQGFGILISFFNAYRIVGFIRTFLILITVFMAFWFIAVLGLFDTWFNFRALFKKKKSKKN
jgi:hypothetical protein